MGRDVIRDLRTKYHDELHGVDEEDRFEEEQDVLTALAEIDRLKARLKLAEAVCEAYGELQRRRIEGGISRQAAMALDQQYDTYLAGKKKVGGKLRARRHASVPRERNAAMHRLRSRPRRPSAEE
jgi:hypothetical protein